MKWSGVSTNNQVGLLKQCHQVDQGGLTGEIKNGGTAGGFDGLGKGGIGFSFGWSAH